MRTIPFLERFREPILSGQKSYTARTKAYGKAGQILLSSFGAPIELISVEHQTLGWIRDNLWPLEGVSGPEDFEQVWRELHHGFFDPGEKVWLHHFRLYKPEVWI